ncbi:unnamed protein product, partial [Amoebophrya sp. A120]
YIQPLSGNSGGGGGGSPPPPGPVRVVYNAYMTADKDKVCEDPLRIPLTSVCKDVTCGSGWGPREACESECNKLSECKYMAYYSNDGCAIFRECPTPLQHDQNAAGGQYDIFLYQKEVTYNGNSNPTPPQLTYSHFQPTETKKHCDLQYRIPLQSA